MNTVPASGATSRSVTEEVVVGPRRGEMSKDPSEDAVMARGRHPGANDALLVAGCWRSRRGSRSLSAPKARAAATPRWRAACGVRKRVHAARRYSWRDPPSRSRRRTAPRSSWPRPADWSGGSGGLQPQRPVGTVSVVMLDVDPQDLRKVAAADDQQPDRMEEAARPARQRRRRGESHDDRPHLERLDHPGER
jgi:hypothetical protein